MKTDFNLLKATYDLSGKRVAVLATDGFEQSELDVPVEALQTCGAQVDIVAPKAGTIRGWSGKDWGQSRKVDKALAEVNADYYDSLVLPGGVLNSDKLRTIPDAVEFVREFFEQQKPVAAICHAGQLLIEADLVDGRTLTSYSSIRLDLENAGATWEDLSVVVDNGLTTSRSPDDLPDFCNKMCEEILEGAHRGQHA
ncbi:type 1 glutamine amidotransferase [Luteolibacter yonseiensis]|uniref:Type 1 glutamine amidotransferase n=1 Tax=Luteolibacter yonseiensis TaxID=1144680 RepID=A0A934V9Y3_9BACT|nr:type 1 glutamine amidotransferase domain-containing protein [Luteolibacter yonseiensis]MBK1814281.1 type 1 glutamine amidotransferase [Luteolibacter yonseiensis]